MAKAIQDARAVWSTAELLGFRMTVLDIGGGFQSSESEFAPMAEAASEAIAEAGFPAHTSFMAEPGRFLARSVYTLVSRVIGRRRSQFDGCVGDEPGMLYQNDGVYGNFMNVLAEHATFAPDELVETQSHDGGLRRGGLHEYSIWGPTCDSLDRLTTRASFECEVKVDDWLVYRNMGGERQLHLRFGHHDNY